MANEKKLDCVILGLLSHEDLTGYDIKKRIDTALKYFWRASFGSIYPTLKELVADGLAEKIDTAENDRNKITYRITEQGRQHLKNWLELSVKKDELRYETLLKLFFADVANPKTSIRHVENFEARIRADFPYLLSAVKNLEVADSSDKAHIYYLLTARFGVKIYSAYLEWCEEAKQTLAGIW
ncbi:MAG: PadR family transcriptional regulator [Oscillospiraceae bacterium]|jgi:DNA-binding PadR family transcriptional regulator|nr:PadR family transcriptional regulator [Oscillospiraceae bacterium]